MHPWRGSPTREDLCCLATTLAPSRVVPRRGARRQSPTAPGPDDPVGAGDARTDPRARHQIPCDHDDHSADGRHDDRGEVDPVHVVRSGESTRDKAADQTADDPEDDVADDPEALVAWHEQPRQPAGDCTDDQPRDDAHPIRPFPLAIPRLLSEGIYLRPAGMLTTDRERLHRPRERVSGRCCATILAVQHRR